MRAVVAAVLLMGASGAGAVPACRQPERPVVQGGARLEVKVEGSGPPVLMIPSLGRGPADFDSLSAALVAANFTSIRYAPRWFAPSDGPEAATLNDLGKDAAAVAAAACPGQSVTVIGHALGNRVARALAADTPAVVSSVILLAAGGQVPIPPGIAGAIARAAAEGELGEAERLRALEIAFFAPGNDARVWLTGWSPRAATLQGRAVRATVDSGWTTAGQAPLLVIQPTRDPVAPFANGEALARAAGDRVTLLALNQASHAILPEQPAAVAAVVLAWLRGERDRQTLQLLIDAATVMP